MMRIGYFAHWNRPQWAFVDFLKEQGYDIEKIDFSQKNYLEKYDIALIEQNGFNDYIENDEIYIRDWVKRGGICFFMHQDYQRWAPYFLPHELGYTQLIHRYIPTVNTLYKPNPEPHYIYMMPWAEGNGKQLFNYPEKINTEEMLDWRICANTFGVIRPCDILESEASPVKPSIRSAATSCFLANSGWEILGSYMDPGVRDGALILQAKYGKGLYFLNQILVPEEWTEGAERCLAFWKKYMRNLIAYFENFRAGSFPEIPAPGSLPAGRRNYKTAIHMHSLDWYGCDTAPGTINAMMHYKNYDICALALKDAAPYNGKLDPAKYSDERVLFLDGQEYHPFNWNDRFEHISHNNYHILAVGIDHDAYTPEFTLSLFSDEEVDDHLNRALKYIHDHNGAAIATHPWNVDYWRDYPYDAIDDEDLGSQVGTSLEKYWLEGKRMPIMNSVDLFGLRRIIDNPASNFLYLNGEKPCRDSVVKAIKKGNVIAACGFDVLDITCNDKLPGEEIARSDKARIHITAGMGAGYGNIRELCIYGDDKMICSQTVGKSEIDIDIDLENVAAEKFIRVELLGDDERMVAVTTPYYIV